MQICLKQPTFEAIKFTGGGIFHNYTDIIRFLRASGVNSIAIHPYDAGGINEMINITIEGHKSYNLGVGDYLVMFAPGKIGVFSHHDFDLLFTEMEESCKSLSS